MDYLRPDGKTQVTVEYDENGKPVRVDTVVLSTQHSPDVTLEQIRKDMIELVIKPTVPAGLLDGETKIYVNPTGRFVIGGPAGRHRPDRPARSSWTPTAAARPTAAALSPARTPPRWTAARPTPPAGWPRTWWPPAWRDKCQVQLAYAIGVAQTRQRAGGDVRHRRGGRQRAGGRCGEGL